EVDYALFIQGFLEVTGTGKAADNLVLNNSHTTSFGFTCDGKGCASPPDPDPQITNNSADTANHSSNSNALTAKARIDIIPKLFTGLSIDVDYDAFSVRTGPEPAIDGDLLGAACESSASKTTM